MRSGSFTASRYILLRYRTDLPCEKNRRPVSDLKKYTIFAITKTSLAESATVICCYFVTPPQQDHQLRTYNQANIASGLLIRAFSEPQHSVSLKMPQ